jgi:cold shock CspA family protein
MADRAAARTNDNDREPTSADIGPVNGTVRRILADKGFGFVLLEDGKTEIFFHKTSFGGEEAFEDLQPDDKVTVVYANTRKGWRASRVNLR